MNVLKKIVIIGPESTGKSTLCSQLAAHYKTRWCPEYAREYLLKNGADYTFDDLLTIAKGQLALEENYVQAVSINTANAQPSTSKYLFIDTDQYVMKVWCEFVFNQCHTWILNRIAERPYDLYLLCDTDLPWVKDELREYPNEKPRLALYQIYKDLMIHQSTPWAHISGNYEERFTRAISAIDKFLPL